MDKNFDLVSVVIPVYNVEKYLNDCVFSVVNQTYSNIEIILVNDGSTDDCQSIIEHWKRKDSRVRGYYLKNSGVTAARAFGVHQSRGRWISFVDADDSLPQKAIELLIFNSNNCEIVVGNPLFYGPYSWPFPRINKEYSRSAFLKTLLRRKVSNAPWAKLYLKNLFDEKTFDIPPKIINGEDMLMNLRLVQNSQVVKQIDSIVYNYFYRENSALSKMPYASISYTFMYIWQMIRCLGKNVFRYVFPLGLSISNRFLLCLRQRGKKWLQLFC